MAHSHIRWHFEEYVDALATADPEEALFVCGLDAHVGITFRRILTHNFSRLRIHGPSDMWMAPDQIIDIVATYNIQHYSQFTLQCT